MEIWINCTINKYKIYLLAICGFLKTHETYKTLRYCYNLRKKTSYFGKGWGQSFFSLVFFFFFICQIEDLTTVLKQEIAHWKTELTAATDNVISNIVQPSCWLNPDTKMDESQTLIFKRKWETNITISNEQVLRMKQSKFTTTGLNAKRYAYLFFFFFSSLYTLSSHKQDEKPIKFYICHISQTCINTLTLYMRLIGGPSFQVYSLCS